VLARNPDGSPAVASSAPAVPTEESKQ